MNGNLKEKNNKGFSLIELVVVVGVLAVLSAIAIPSFICFPKRARATAALAALRQIKTECALKEAEAKPEIFSSSALDGYTIQTSGSNSCAGSNGVISLIPNSTDELPTFNLAAATGSLTYKFKGKTGTNFTECLGMICGDGARLASLPPNESTLFGPDSGLSCREVKSSPLKFMYGNHYLAYGNEEVTLQPMTISIGEKSWDIKDIKSQMRSVPHYQGTAGVDLQWLDDFAKKAVEVINESEGEFSAELDPDNRGGIKIYSSKGIQQKNIELSVSQLPDYSNINSYAFPALGEYDPDKYRWRGRHQSDAWNEEKNAYQANIGDKTTTVCDGR